MDLHLRVLYSFILLLFMSFNDASRLNVATQRLDVKPSNRIPLKSIKSPDGDIIDCIDIYQQPAFDHPLLKNHTIQMRPSYSPQGAFVDHHTESIISQLWHKNGRCPEGTIPIIRRTQKEDLLRAKSIKNYGKKKNRSINPQQSSVNSPIPARDGHEHAIAFVKGGEYYGAKATINVWEPQVQGSTSEFSSAQIWVTGGNSFDNLNSIEAGWQVYPNQYGDTSPRFFIFSTKDGYKTGCYNLQQCSNFIQINQEIALGGTFSPSSTYQGTQFDINVVIFKDREHNQWWLQIENDNIGYWPISFYPNLQTASGISWGGEVLNSKQNGQHTTTQMGSGHFAEDGIGGANYFENLQIVDESNHLIPPNDPIQTLVDAPNCYNLNLFKNDALGNFFLFGGPGRNPNCS